MYTPSFKSYEHITETVSDPLTVCENGVTTGGGSTVTFTICEPTLSARVNEQLTGIVFVSALFGVTVKYTGEPLMPLWLLGETAAYPDVAHVSDVSEIVAVYPLSVAATVCAAALGVVNSSEVGVTLNVSGAGVGDESGAGSTTTPKEPVAPYASLNVMVHPLVAVCGVTLYPALGPLLPPESAAYPLHVLAGTENAPL
ncbi:MAG: hypothetical protein ACYDDA_13540 [Acidiferrobacteraceae bacterium]